MGRNSYNGGGTVVHAGSGFFTHKGGGRRKKPLGSDEPGAPKPGSICDFSPIRPRKKTVKVIEFPVRSPEQKQIEKQAKERKKVQNRARSLIKRTTAAVKRSESLIRNLRQTLRSAEANHVALKDTAALASGIDLEGLDLFSELRKLEDLLTRLVSSNATQQNVVLKSRKAKKRR